jgi:glycosyltransferase involved in cell wall biosynthesis
MRVLHVLGELRASGGEVMLRDAVAEFRRNDVEPVVLSTGERVGDFAAAYLDAGVEVLHIPFRKSAGFAIRFLRLVRDARVEAVHLHTERASFALGLLVLLARKRAVRTIHSVFAYTGALRAVRTVERAVLRALGVVHIAIGPSVERNELTRLRNPAVRVDNWIGGRFRPPSDEEHVLARAGFDLRPDQLVLTTIGNCSRIKNHEALLRALPAIATAVNRPVVYLHAGSGADADAERVIAESVHSDNVEIRFLGTVTDVLPLLWASDIYCMPSLHEGVGIAALEALASGVPAVLADVDGLRDVHPPAQSVKFTAPRPDSIASGVRALLDRDSLPLAAARAVAERVQHDRTMERQVEKLVRLYWPR